MTCWCFSCYHCEYYIADLLMEVGLFLFWKKSKFLNQVIPKNYSSSPGITGLVKWLNLRLKLLNYFSLLSRLGPCGNDCSNWDRGYRCYRVASVAAVFRVDLNWSCRSWSKLCWKDRLGTEALKMVQIAGKYTFVSQDNFEEYLKAAGGSQQLP